MTAPLRQIPLAWLQQNAEKMALIFEPWLKKRDQNKISPAEFACLYVILWTAHWKDSVWLNGTCHPNEFLISQNLSEKILHSSKIKISDGLQNFSFYDEKISNMTLPKFLFTKRLRGVSLRSQRTLLCWLAGYYPLDLRFDIPTPVELLALQAEGKRVVSVFRKKEDFYLKHHGRDVLTFTLHDLEHADEFFFDAQNAREQTQFYKNLYVVLNEDPCLTELKNNPFLREKIEYVVSDMNSHIEHIKGVLKAVWREYASAEKNFFETHI